MFPEETIVFIGLKHSGKTSVGKLLAEHLERPFYDSDALLEERSNLSCREIYVRLGKREFDRLQLEVLQDLFQNHVQQKPVIAPVVAPVIALGGGVADLPDLSDWLKPCHVILLSEDLWRIFERIQASGLPPFLENAADPFTEFQHIAEQRLHIYRSWADTVLECRGRTVEEIMQEQYDLF